MEGYAKMARPLNEFISGENASQKNRPVQWEEEHQITFEQLKELSMRAPVLAYANYQKPFRVYTDASELGLCTVPFTVQPFAYTSCTSRLRAPQGSHQMGDQWHQL